MKGPFWLAFLLIFQFYVPRSEAIVGLPIAAFIINTLAGYMIQKAGEASLEQYLQHNLSPEETALGSLQNDGQMVRIVSPVYVHSLNEYLQRDSLALLKKYHAKTTDRAHPERAQKTLNEALAEYTIMNEMDMAQAIALYQVPKDGCLLQQPVDARQGLNPCQRLANTMFRAILDRLRAVRDMEKAPESAFSVLRLSVPAEYLRNVSRIIKQMTPHLSAIGDEDMSVYYLWTDLKVQLRQTQDSLASSS
jgi:hypothetical protein